MQWSFYEGRGEESIRGEGGFDGDQNFYIGESLKKKRLNFV